MTESATLHNVQDVRMPVRETPPPPGYISIEEAGRLVGVGRATSYKLAAKGGEWEREGVKIYRVTERLNWIERASLLAWIKARGGPELE